MQRFNERKKLQEVLIGLCNKIISPYTAGATFGS